MDYQFKVDDYIRAMLALYQETNPEITRYRDYEWKLPIWSAALLVFVAGISGQIDLSAFDYGKKYILKTILGSFSLVATAYSCWYIYFIHERLTENRRIRRSISNILKFSEKDVYAKDSLLPEKYRSEMPKFSQGLPHIIAAWTFIVLALIYALVFVFAK